MRQDPPFDMAYITATHLLEHVSGKVLVVNDPASVRNAPEKLVRHAISGPDAADPDHQRPRRIDPRFRKKHGDIILKPLFGNGGAGVFRLRPEDENLNALLEMFTQLYREPVMVQRYLPRCARATSASSWSRASPWARSFACRPRARRAPISMSAARRGEDRPSPRATARSAPPSARSCASGPGLRRHRRDRRLPDRDQRHLADRHSGNQPARRRQARGRGLGRDRATPEGFFPAEKKR